MVLKYKNINETFFINDWIDFNTCQSFIASAVLATLSGKATGKDSILSIFKIHFMFSTFYCFQHFSGSSVCYSLAYCICTSCADFVGFLAARVDNYQGTCLLLQWLGKLGTVITLNYQQEYSSVLFLLKLVDFRRAMFQPQIVICSAENGQPANSILLHL